MARRTRPAGSACRTPTTYPWQWLWDSCFHAVVWAHLGDERALQSSCAARCRRQDDDGFVPHLRYGDGPFPHEALWGRRDASTHHPATRCTATPSPSSPGSGWRPTTSSSSALSAGWSSSCVDGAAAPAGWWSSATRGSRAATTAPAGTTRCPAGARPAAWYELKGELVALDRAVARAGRPSTTRRSRSARSGFSALVAWNALELASVTGDDDLGDAARASWPTRSTPAGTPTCRRGSTTDPTAARLRPHPHPRRAAPVAGPPAAGGVRARSLDPAAYGAPCGPRGVHAAEPTYEPATYWRGPAWPQLTYLLWLAATSSGSDGGRLGAGEVDGDRARSARGSPSTGWPTRARRSVPCPRPGRPSRWRCAAGR